MGDFAQLNADMLDRALQARRRALQGVDREERERGEFALAAIEGYAALLREPMERAPSRNLSRYSFKLVSRTVGGASTRSSCPPRHMRATSSTSPASATGGSRGRSASA
jgi:hypothetical protein